MTSYDGLFPQAQRKYRISNTVRKVTMVFAWAFTLIGTTILVIKGIKVGDIGLFPVMLTLFFFSFLGSIPHAVVHSETIFIMIMHVMKKFGDLGCIIGFVIYLVTTGLLMYAGGILLIVDTILFILKKPLIYPFENKCFKYTRRAEMEMQIIAGKVRWLQYMRVLNEFNMLYDEDMRNAPSYFIPENFSIMYYVVINGQSTGPYDISTVLRLLNYGRITVDSLIWRQGITDWLRVCDMHEVMSIYFGYSEIEFPLLFKT